MSILQAKNLSISYEAGNAVLHGVNLDIQAGEIVTLIGKSGSGKTTLIKLLAGLLEPSHGQVLFHGELLDGPNRRLVPGHKEIRLVHQDFQLHHRMTVEENLYNALIDYVDEYKKERTTELLELCGLTGIKDQMVHQISGGEKQRTAIAMALATEPDVLLLDEPFSNLDLQIKMELLSLVRDIADTLKTAIVLITHDTRDGLEIADRVVVLSSGKIIRTGSPDRVYHDPQFPEVAQLFGLYNLLSPATVEALGVDKSKGEGMGIWPENVSISDAGHKALVKRVYFLGPFNRLHIQLENGQSLIVLDPDQQTKKQQNIQIQLPADKLFHLTNLAGVENSPA